MDFEEDPEAVDSSKSTFSISKGVFVFRGSDNNEKSVVKSPTKKRPGKKRTKSPKRRKDSEKSEDDQIWSHPVYAKCVEEFEANLADIQRKGFAVILESVRRFAAEETKAENPLRLLSSSSNGIIPTAALLLGVNAPDHSDFFGLLAKDLRESVTPHVAVLRSEIAKSTLRSLVQSTVSQLMLQNNEDEEDDDEDENIDDRVSSVSNLKKANQVLPTLVAWYNKTYNGQNVSRSPKKKAKKSTKQQRPPLVIILEDFEGFPSHILQDFFLNLIEYSKDIPVTLVLGVATTITVIHQRLPHHVFASLSLKKFALQRSTELLSKVVDSIFASSDIPIKIGGSVLDQLHQVFIVNDFSVKKFVSAYKYCLLEHCFSMPLETLICVTDERDRSRVISGFKTNALDHFRSLRSFRKFVEADIKERHKLLVNDEKFKEFLESSIKSIYKTQLRFSVVISALNVTTKDLIGAPLGMQITSVYNRAFMRPIVDTHEYRDAFNILRVLGITELRSKLEKVSSVIKDSLTENLQGDRKILELNGEITELLSRVDHFIANPEDTAKDSSSNTPRKSTPLSPATTNKKEKLSRFELQQQLLEKAKDSNRKKLSPFEELRKEILDFLHKTFSKFLGGGSEGLPNEMVFNEVIYFDRVSSVRRHLLAAPRGVIPLALSNPGIYLENEKLEIDDDYEIPRDFPDVSISYKIHSEYGRLINLYDWLQAWISVVKTEDENSSEAVNEKPKKAAKGRKSKSKKTGENEEENSTANKEDIDPLLQARFTQSVSALQFLGFIKSSKRKTDHVTKLTS